MLKIERSIMELVDLLEILNQQIVMQGQVVEDVAQKAEQATDNLGNANVHIDKGIQSARRARKLKWWCLGVCILIAIVIALGVGLGVALTRNSNNSNNSNDSSNGNSNGNSNNLIDNSNGNSNDAGST